MNSLAEMSNPMKRGGGRGVEQPMERKRQNSNSRRNEIIKR